MKQSKFVSFIEALVNTTIGYVIALSSQLIIFPKYNIHISVETNVKLTLWFTLISIIRSYIIRRFFNKG